MSVEAPAGSGAAFRQTAEMLANAAVESLDHAVCLRTERPGQLVGDVTFSTQPVDGVLAGGPVDRLMFLIDGEAVGPFAAIVCQDGVYAVGEVREEPFEKAARRAGAAVAVDLDIDVTRGPVDGGEAAGDI